MNKRRKIKALKKAFANIKLTKGEEKFVRFYVESEKFRQEFIWQKSVNDITGDCPCNNTQEVSFEEFERGYIPQSCLLHHSKYKEQRKNLTNLLNKHKRSLA